VKGEQLDEGIAADRNDWRTRGNTLGPGHPVGKKKSWQEKGASGTKVK
jgi:hypothetical protein